MSPHTHFALRQKSAFYFSKKSYPFLPRKTLNQPNGSCCPSTGKMESNNQRKKYRKKSMTGKKEVVALTFWLEGSMERKAAQSGREATEEK